MPKSKKPVSVFIVDDDDIDALLIKRALQAHTGPESIFRARDGLEALEMLAAGAVPAPRIILLDINMPRMNGLEFLVELRQRELHQENVVFIVSSSDYKSDIATAYQWQVAGYVKKSTDPSGIAKFVAMLQQYWEVVILPDRSEQD